MNTRRIISSITRVNTLPPANETNCFINSSTVLVGAANTHILLVKNAKSTASTHDITFAISSLIPIATLKNAYEPILTAVVSTPKKRYKSTLTTAAVLDLLIDGNEAVNNLKLEFKGV